MVYLYTSETCPKCRVVKAKLAQKNISYEERNEEAIPTHLDVAQLPVLQYEDVFLCDLGQIVKWINDWEG